MRIVVLLILASLVCACSSRESRAVAACEKEIAAKITDKTYQIDTSDMTAKAKAEADDVIRIQSGITFDPGLPREVKQTFDCKVRVTADSADVILLQFIW